LEKARALVKRYTENVAVADIGYIDRELLHEFYGIQSSRPKTGENVINQEMREVGKVPVLGAPTE
jgi:hypothetical protein